MRSNFSNVQKLLIFAKKKLITRAEKSFSSNEYLKRNPETFVTIGDFERFQGFCLKKRWFFSENIQVVNFLGIFTIPIAIMAELPHFGVKKVSRSEMQANIICSVSSIVKQRVK